MFLHPLGTFRVRNEILSMPETFVSLKYLVLELYFSYDLNKSRLRRWQLEECTRDPTHILNEQAQPRWSLVVKRANVTLGWSVGMGTLKCRINILWSFDSLLSVAIDILASTYTVWACLMDKVGLQLEPIIETLVVIVFQNMPHDKWRLIVCNNDKMTMKWRIILTSWFDIGFNKCH